jgi:hypothetical protein
VLARLKEEEEERATYHRVGYRMYEDMRVMYGNRELLNPEKVER